MGFDYLVCTLGEIVVNAQRYTTSHRLFKLVVAIWTRLFSAYIGEIVVNDQIYTTTHTGFSLFSN